MDASGEKPVGQRLGEHIGELLLVQLGDENFAEGAEPVVQPAVFLLVLEGATIRSWMMRVIPAMRGASSLAVATATAG